MARLGSEQRKAHCRLHVGTQDAHKSCMLELKTKNIVIDNMFDLKTEKHHTVLHVGTEKK